MALPTVRYNYGDIVYLITDKEQLERMVVGHHVRDTSVQYILACGPSESYHYEAEILTTKNWKICS